MAKVWLRLKLKQAFKEKPQMTSEELGEVLGCHMYDAPQIARRTGFNLKVVEGYNTKGGARRKLYEVGK